MTKILFKNNKVFFAPKTINYKCQTLENNEFSKIKPSLYANKIRILHQNIAGICNKSDLLEIALSDLKNNDMEIDILCLTETNVKNGYEANIKLKNYKLISLYSRDKSRGGSCIFVKKKS